MGIDRTIDALVEALAAAGVDPPTAPSDPAVLDRVEDAITPLRLPRDLRAFWERVDPATLRLWVLPRLIGPTFAYDTWKQVREEFPASAPAALLLVGYESWNCLSVELDYERRADAMGPVLHVQDPETGLALAAPRQPLPPHPRYGNARSVGRAPREWPVHWQRLSGIDSDDLRPHGATHTIAELLASDPRASLEATIAGRVVDLGTFGATTRLRVSDGSGEIAVDCPAAVTALGPGCGLDFEFDVVVPSGPRHAAVDLATLPPVEDPVRHLSQQLMARYGGPAAAVATAIRPMDTQ